MADKEHLSADSIVELADDLKLEFRAQHTEDEITRDMLHREHAVQTPRPEPGVPIKKIISGYPALIVQQDYSFLTTPPFIRVNPLKPEQERHSEKLETALLGMWKLSQGIADVWLDMVYDFVWAGRGFSKIYPVPELWSTGFAQREDEKEEDFLTRVRELKEETFPIIWKSVPVENTWPMFDLRGDLDRVIEMREMKARDIRRHYGENLLPDVRDSEMVTVYDFADSNWTQVVIKHADTKQIVQEWEHGMGVCPYIMLQTPRSAPRGKDIHWTGALYHTRNILSELDGLLTDIRYNVKRASRGQPIFNLDLEGRGVTPEQRGQPDVIKFEPTKPIFLDLQEGVKELDPAKTNIDAYRLVEIITTLTREVAVRSVLLGILQSGTTGILYNTAAQFAQKQYGPAVSQLEKGAIDVGRKFFKAIESFLDNDEEIPILFATAGGTTKRVSISRNMVKGWSRSLQARIDLAIPINEASDITNFRLVTDPENPAMGYEDAAARYLHIENPAEQEDKILRTQMRRALWPVIIQLVQTQGLQIAMSEQGGSPDELQALLQGLPPTIQSAIGNFAQTTGQQVPGGPGGGVPEGQNLARGRANTAKAGRFQGPSDTGLGQLSPERTATGAG